MTVRTTQEIVESIRRRLPQEIDAMLDPVVVALLYAVAGEVHDVEIQLKEIAGLAGLA
jgi:hypothetical protein